MRIAYIVPSLDAMAPITLALRLAQYFVLQGHYVKVFYFDDIVKQTTCCKTERISMNKAIDFDSFDIVHSHMFRPDKYLYVHNSKIVRARLISTIHCDIFEDLRLSYGWIVSAVFHRLWIKYLNSFDATVQISDFLLDRYEGKLSKNVLIYNSVNVSLVKDTRIEQIKNQIIRFKDKGKRVICSFSRIIELKGLMQILKAVLRDDTLSYVCVGNGPHRSKLEKYCKNNNLCERVKFYDSIPSPYMLMEEADVFCIPSYSEGFSLALLEAGTVGSSVVCSSIPSFNRIFSEDEVSFFELNNIESMLNAISEAIEQKDRKKQALKNRISRDFTQERMFKGYEQLYKKLINTNDIKVS